MSIPATALRRLCLWMTLMAVASPLCAEVHDFGTVNVGAKSGVVSVNVVFTTSAIPARWSVLTKGALNKDYIEDSSGTTCNTATTYNSGATCKVGVAFNPQYPGLRMGGVQVLDGSGNVVATALLKGVGSGPEIVFPGNSPITLASSTSHSDQNITVVDGNGNIYTASHDNGSVLEIEAVNGVASASSSIRTVSTSFHDIEDLAIDGNGDIFVADAYYGDIYEIVAVNGVIPTNPTIITVSHTGMVQGITVDANGNVFALLYGNATYLMEFKAVNGQIPPNQTYSIIYIETNAVDIGGMAVDASGDVFFAAHDSEAIKEIVAVNGNIPTNPTVKTVLSLDNHPSDNYPHNVAFDGAGNLYVATDCSVYLYSAINGQITQSSPSATYTYNGSCDGYRYVTVDAQGNLFVGMGNVNEYPLATAPSHTFPTSTLVNTTDTTDRAYTVTIANRGNADLSLIAPSSGNNPEVSDNFTWDSSSSCSQLSSGSSDTTLKSNDSCNIAIDFTPTEAGSISGSVSLTDNTLNATSPNYTTQTIELNGTATSNHVPTITTWPTASTITYGQSLASSTLSGGVASPGGVFAWTSSSTVPEAGSSSQSVTYMPTDTTYSRVQGTVRVNVNPATPVIAWTPAVASLAYGAALSTSQLNAMATDGSGNTIAGTFAYTAGSTTLNIGNVLGAGSYTVTATFTPTDTTDYASGAKATATLTVTQATPTIAWTPAVASLAYSTALSTNQLNATAKNGAGNTIAGTFAYTAGSTTLNTGNVLGVGSYTVTATFTPTDATDYMSGGKATATLTVTQATPTIAWTPSVSSFAYGAALSTSQLNATAKNGAGNTIAGTFAYTAGSTILNTGNVLGVGSYTVTATFTPTDTTDYVSGGKTTATLTVNQTTPVIAWTPAVASLAYGTALSTDQLNATATDGSGNTIAGTFAYAAGSTTLNTGNVLDVGSYTVTATFTPTDTTDYVSGGIATATLTVNQLAPTLNLTAGSSNTVLGSVANLTAQLSSSLCSGYVTFYDGVTVLGTAVVSSSQAAFSYVAEWPGSRSLYAQYFGGVNCTAVTSSALTQTVTANTGGKFISKGVYSIGSNPTGVLVGDFNQDGIADIGVVDPDTGTVTLALGEGSANFANGGKWLSGYKNLAALADVNHDGLPDLITVNPSAGTISVRLGTGLNTFASTTTDYTVGANPQAIAVGNFNGDDYPDLAVTNYDASTVTILLGQSDGTFGVNKTLSLSAAPLGIAAADLRSNGNTDLVVTNPTAGTISVYLGNGDGTFNSATTYSAGSQPHGIAIGDVNGDGLPDVVVTNYDTGKVSVLDGDGTGSFTLINTYSVGSHPTDVALGEFNGDGHADMVVANNGDSNIQILLGGAFSDLTIDMTNSGQFIPGQSSADGEFDVTVTNSGDAATDSTVTASVTLPSGVTAGSISGTGWSCSSISASPLTCTRGDALAVGSSYPMIAVMVKVNSGVTGNLSATAVVAGGGEINTSNDSASDTVHADQVATTTALSASSAVYGDTVLKAIVASAYNTPAGTVIFTENGTSLGSTTFTGGTATLSLPTLSAGQHTILASFQETSEFLSSSSNATITVTPATAAINVTPYSVAYDGSAHTATGTATGVGGTTLSSSDLTLTGTTHTSAGTYATDTWSFSDPNYASASGTVSDKISPATATINVTPYSVTYDGSAHTAMGTATSVGGATLSSSDLTLTGTTHTAAGTYATDAWSFSDPSGNYAASSGTVSDKIAQAVLTLIANNATKVYGAADPTFAGSIMGQQGSDSFTESFSTVAVALSPVGPYAIVPSASGNNLLNYSQSVTDGTLTVTQASTTTKLSTNLISIAPGGSLQLTAQVTPQFSGSPTGTVTFSVGNTQLGQAAVTNGTATLTTTALSAIGTSSLTANYGGDTNFASSNSTASTVTVVASNFTVALVSSPSQRVIRGSSTTYVFQVTPVDGVFSEPVSFSLTGLPAGTTYTFSPSTIAAGSGAQQATLTIHTAAVTSSGLAPTSKSPAPLALALMLPALFALCRLRRRAQGLVRLGCLLLVLGVGTAAVTLLGGCGGRSSKNNQTYYVTVTASSPSYSHQVSVTLDIEQ
jgi:hypothetical protein